MTDEPNTTTEHRTTSDRRSFLRTTGAATAALAAAPGLGAAREAGPRDTSAGARRHSSPQTVGYRDTSWSTEFSFGTEKGQLDTNYYIWQAHDWDRYWKIPFEIGSDAACWLDDGSSISKRRDIYASDFEITWDGSKYSEDNVVYKHDSNHIGGWDHYISNPDKVSDATQYVVEEGIETLISKIPADEKWEDAAGILAEIAMNYVNLDTDSSEKWATYFNWGDDGFDYAHQVDYWHAMDIHLDAEQQLTLTIWDQMEGQGSLTSNYFDITIYAPRDSPSTASTMTTSERRRKGITSAPGREIRQNPRQYGFSREEGRKLDPDETVYFAPVGVEVTDRTPPNEQ